MNTEKRPFLPMKVAPHTPNRIATPCGSISVVWYNNEYEDPYIKAEEAAAFVALAGNAHDDLVAALDKLVNAKALSGVRQMVAGWNGENLPEGRHYERHPKGLGATLPKTNCGAVYDLDDAMTAALAALSKARGE